MFGIEGTRWTLERIGRVCDWLGEITAGGLSQLLDRLEVSYKRGRQHLHSPDPDYDAKLEYLVGLVDKVRAAPGRFALVYLDELTVYRQPTLAQAWEERGRHQALAELSHRTNQTKTRIVGTVDFLTGRVIYQRGDQIGPSELVEFYQRRLRPAYEQAERIYAVQDNWPHHFHADVLVALEEQEEQLRQWPQHRPGNWTDEPSPQAKAKWKDLHLPIQLVRLPTYAPWTNPIEKLWRWLYQEVLHLHRLADKLGELRAQIDAFLERFANGSLDLLRYIGLLRRTEPNC